MLVYEHSYDEQSVFVGMCCNFIVHLVMAAEYLKLIELKNNNLQRAHKLVARQSLHGKQLGTYVIIVLELR